MNVPYVRRTLAELDERALREACDELREAAKIWEHHAGELAGSQVGAGLEARALRLRRVAQVLEDERLSR